MFPWIAALLGCWIACFATASARTPGPVAEPEQRRDLVLLPLTLHSDHEPLKAELEAVLTAGLRRAGHAVHRSSTACRDANCRRSAMRDSGAGVVVSAELKRVGPDVGIVLSAYEGDTEQPFATSDGTCEICGNSELLRQTGDVAGLLSRRLAVAERAATLAVRGDPSDAALVLDEKYIGSAPHETTVEPGTHTLRIAKTGFQTQERTWTAAPGVTETVDFLLHATPVTAAPVADRRPNWWWALPIVGAPLVGTGAALMAIDGQPHTRTCPDSALDLAGQCPNVRTTMTGGVLLTVVGVAAIVTGVTMLIRRHRGAARNSAYGRAAPGPGWDTTPVMEPSVEGAPVPR